MLKMLLPDGSLMQVTFDLFAQAGFSLRRLSDRGYQVSTGNKVFGDTFLLRPQEIPFYVADGRFDIAVTGQDWIEEQGLKDSILEILPLPISRQGVGSVKIVLAVPAKSPLAKVQDFTDTVTVSTEYPNLVRRFFQQFGLQPEIITSYGGTEAKPIAGISDAIVDVTETGTSLSQGGFRIIDIIRTAQACLIASKQAWEDPQKQEEIRGVALLLDAAIKARPCRLVKCNVGRDKLEEVLSILPTAKSPTVSELASGTDLAIESVVPADSITDVIPCLKKAGASAIIVLDIQLFVP